MSQKADMLPQVLDVAQDRARIEASLRRLDRIARLMDDQFELPWIKKRIGLDPLIGLIPGGGDWVVWCVGVYIFFIALRLGAPTRLLLHMAYNTAVDLLGGYAPVVGDIFDAFYKSNKRNVGMLRAHFGASPELGSALPSVLPTHALEALHVSKSSKYALAALVCVALLGLACGPFVLIFFLFKQ